MINLFPTVVGVKEKWGNQKMNTKLINAMTKPNAEISFYVLGTICILRALYVLLLNFVDILW